MFAKYVDTESGVANMNFLELKSCYKLKELISFLIITHLASQMYVLPGCKRQNSGR